ncbi:MAG: nitrite reductase (NADH) small subunit [Alteromonadaceae bacterium]|jgi:nitrite reductase (NADH) small subunit
MTNIAEHKSKEANELTNDLSNGMSNKNNDWLTICNIADIAKNTGVCADFNGKQVAIFHIQTTGDDDTIRGVSAVKAVCNRDPFSQANVLSRGLITEKERQYYVASPLLKQEFCLDTGQCQQDNSIVITTYKSRIDGDLVQLMEA